MVAFAFLFGSVRYKSGKVRVEDSYELSWRILIRRCISYPEDCRCTLRQTQCKRLPELVNEGLSGKKCEKHISFYMHLIHKNHSVQVLGFKCLKENSHRWIILETVFVRHQRLTEVFLAQVVICLQSVLRSLVLWRASPLVIFSIFLGFADRIVLKRSRHIRADPVP